MSTTILLNNRRIVRLLIGITVFLVIISFAGNIFQLSMGGDSADVLVQEWVRVINISVDGNIPTWYSSLLLLASSILIGVIALAAKADKSPYTRHWVGLGIIFLLFSVDETAVIHENFSWIVYRFIEPGGLLTFGWVLIGGIATIVVGLAYLRFLAHLSRKTGIGLIVAGAVYVGGALVLEAISGSIYAESYKGFAYVITSTLEETFEMTGAIILIYTLLAYIEEKKIGLQVRMERNTLTQNVPTMAESEKSLKQTP